MNKIIFTALVLLNTILVFSQKVNYKLKMTNPQSHYFEVEMILEGLTDKQIEVKMPVWAPGSYLVREFSKNVNQVFAFDENKNAIKTVKTAKNTWQLQNALKGKRISISVRIFIK